MKKIAALFVFLSMTALTGLWSDEVLEIPLNLRKFVDDVLIDFGRNADIVSFTAKENEKDISLSQIKRLDEAWQNANGLDRYMLDLMSNDFALVLWNIEQKYPFIVETFAMNDKGANIAQTAKTSDYWQGDEAKFIESYNNGSGQVHYGNIEFDESANEIILQVSVPVIDPALETLGAITFGFSLDRWERR